MRMEPDTMPQGGKLLILDLDETLVHASERELGDPQISASSALPAAPAQRACGGEAPVAGAPAGIGSCTGQVLSASTRTRAFHRILQGLQPQ